MGDFWLSIHANPGTGNDFSETTAALLAAPYHSNRMTLNELAMAHGARLYVQVSKKLLTVVSL